MPLTFVTRRCQIDTTPFRIIERLLLDHLRVDLTIPTYQLGHLLITSDHGRVERGLIAQITRPPLAPTKQKHTRTLDLAMHGAHMQWRVAHRVARIHVSAVVDQVIDVLRET